MRLIREAARLEEALAPLRAAGRLAFVPTMGALHDGHMALIEAARRRADRVVVSIYVNPRQFGPNEDFDRYPRMLDRDRARCAAAGVDLLFAPQTLYPDDGPKVTLTVDPELSGTLCGASRPGHFDGVATVVAILFHLVRPDLALFGEKDWQQLLIIRRMCADLHFPIRIESVPTVREADGLAMSSRNRNLSPAGRRLAAELPRVLYWLQNRAAEEAGDCRAWEAEAADRLTRAGIAVEYLTIRDGASLRRVHRIDQNSRLFAAVRIDGVRLIDNLPLRPAGVERA
ncbi:MAG: pantoate--beta-alanine ligase [Zetaproteobacteria bacterium]|nr:MAG: pantoate--beta-alanine ligase [Zetaproteobacteria bacterium]